MLLQAGSLAQGGSGKPAASRSSWSDIAQPCSTLALPVLPLQPGGSGAGARAAWGPRRAGRRRRGLCAALGERGVVSLAMRCRFGYPGSVASAQRRPGTAGAPLCRSHRRRELRQGQRLAAAEAETRVKRRRDLAAGLALELRKPRDDGGRGPHRRRRHRAGHPRRRPRGPPPGVVEAGQGVAPRRLPRRPQAAAQRRPPLRAGAARLSA
mmetsp:Transcript_115860/g.360891  ORF Transcript_115860/g.360891 Transcript_115860/m.360891 type:complete len:210 (+) Transcript_115860:115-744(+)